MKKVLLVFVISACIKINAQDRVFTYTYQSNVLNKGQKDIEVWTTMYNGRDNYYRGFQHRLEFEVGLGAKLQTSFYLNYFYDKGISEVNGIQFVQNSVDYSFSNEWKLKLTDPVADVMGSALYFEYLLSPSETELEGKIILDKQIGNFIHAFNLVGEYEIDDLFPVNGATVSHKTHGEEEYDLNYSLSFKLNDKLWLGLEAMDQNHIDNSKWEYSVLTAGPCFSYSTDGFWVNLTFLPQISNLKGGGLELTEHEKFQTRLIFSYSF